MKLTLKIVLVALSLAVASARQRFLAGSTCGSSLNVCWGVAGYQGTCCEGFTCNQFSRKKRCVAKKTVTDEPQLLQCSGYVGSVWGDPHIRTFDNAITACHGKGEYVLVDSPGNIQIHSRFERSNKSNKISLLKGVAVAVEGTETVQVGFAEYDSGDDYQIDFVTKCPLHIYLGGELQAASIGDVISGDGYNVTISASTIDVQYYEGNIPTYAFQFLPSYGSKSGCMLASFVCLPSDKPDVLETVGGLLGTPNGDSDDEWNNPSTGETFDITGNGMTTYEYCTTYHCVGDETDSLLVYEDAHGGKSFSTLESCTEEDPGEVDISEPSDEIVAICGDDEACILDGVVGGEEAAENSVEIIEDNEAIHNSSFATPAPTACPGDIVLLHIEGDTMYEQEPIRIVSQTTDSVTLQIQPAFYSIEADYMYTQYMYNYNEFCVQSDTVSESFSEQITVSCPGSEHSTLVRVIVSDAELDASLDVASVPNCCHGDADSNPKVKYTFLVSCEPQCPESSA